MIKFIIMCFVVFLFFQTANSQTVEGRFVAFDKSRTLTNAREPKQHFIVEIQDEKSPVKVNLIKVVYFVPTNSFRGGAKLLDTNALNYKKVWKLKLSKPSKEEKDSCRQIDNFLRNEDGTVYNDEVKEPVLLFHSTQFNADIMFENLLEMPCMILIIPHFP